MESLAQILLYLAIALAVLLFFGPIIVIISLIGIVEIGPLKIDVRTLGHFGRSLLAIVGLAVWLSVYIPLVLIASRTFSGTATPLPVSIQPLSVTPTTTNTPIPPSPTPRPIVNTENLTGWTFYFDHSGGNQANNKTSLVPGRTDNAVEISYDLGRAGYVIMTRRFDPRVLVGITGISFFYKGTGATNTIEFKLMLKYPGDTDDTTYGILWNRATDTGDNWTQMNVLYSDFTCLWPSENCQRHGNKLDLTVVDRLDFAVSNKPGDQVGSGRVAFDDVWEIQP